MFTYTLAMLAASAFTLVLAPRALRDLGHERQRLEKELPGVSFERLLEAGYRLNTLILLVEIFFYYLLAYTGTGWQFKYGGFSFGLIHIIYLIAGRFEKRRLARGAVRTRLARLLIWITASLTSVELAFLLWVGYLLLNPGAG